VLSCNVSQQFNCHVPKKQGIPSLLGVSAQRDWNVNFLTIPRMARTPTDGILQLTHTNGMLSFYLVLTMLQGLWIIGLDHCVLYLGLSSCHNGKSTMVY
jgi:hypothetical protein